MKNNNFNIEVSASDLVIKLGIPAHLKGFRFIRSAIIIVCEDVSYIERITNRLYPKVAEVCGASPIQVERSIRSAIDSAWFRGGEGMVELIGGNYGKPCSSEIIAIAAEKLRIQKKLAEQNLY